MNVGGEHYRTVWMEGTAVYMINQNKLPFRFEILKSENHWETCMAITDMAVRGAGALGVAAGFAMAQAFLLSTGKNKLVLIREARQDIESTRPTARNLFYAVERVYMAGLNSPEQALAEALKIAEEDASSSQKIGETGAELIGKKANILTHCNAGWLAFTDYGTALSPVYTAKNQGKDVFVYVDETRPRSQGGRLTAWELENEMVPHVVIADNTAASLMAGKKVDMVIVGADRIAANGDTANKIGTLGLAVLAKEFGIPFYVAAPLSTFDISISSGKDIVIEERSGNEVMYQSGADINGNIVKIRVNNPGSKAYNPAFDVTPAKYITAIITEKGIIKPGSVSIKRVFENY